jgi:hypothetical protein
MSNPMSKVKNSGNVKKDEDFLGGGGFKTLPTDVYPMTIDQAFFGVSSGGATTVSLHLSGESGSKTRETFFVTSGTKKGCKNTYLKKAGTPEETEHYLPGFNAINSLCMLTVGEELTSEEIEVAKKTINLYSFDAGKEEPTEVDAIVSLVGAKIIAGIFNCTVDKKAKDDKGDWNPTGEVKQINEINKFFCAREGYENLTLIEIEGEVEEPKFQTDWLERYKDEIIDKSTKTSAKPGAPRESGKQAPKKSIFGKKKEE